MSIDNTNAVVNNADEDFPTTFGAVARVLVENGYQPYPLKRRLKEPVFPGWKNFKPTHVEVLLANRDAGSWGCGVLTGEDLAGVDNDVFHEKASAELAKLAIEILGTGPIRIGQRPKHLILYRAASSFKSIKSPKYVVTEAVDKAEKDLTEDEKIGQVEILAHNSSFTAYAVHQITGEPYQWHYGEPLLVPVHELTVVTEEQMHEYLGEAKKILFKYGVPHAGREAKPRLHLVTNNTTRKWTGKRPEEIAKALDMKETGPGQWLGCCPAHDDNNPSFSLTDEGGKPLVHCHAGCSQEDVISALRERGLWQGRDRESVATNVSQRLSLNQTINLLSTHPVYVSLAFNEMTGQHILQDNSTLSHMHMREFRSWAEEKGFHVARETAWESMLTLAERNKRDPLREMIEDLPKWDGVPRLDTWLVTYAGAVDKAYVRAVGRKWLISAIARALQPGCQADLSLTLVGKQGEGKTSLLRELGGAFYRSMTGKPIGERDTKSELRMAWIAEFADLGSLPKAEASAIRAFLTDKEDSYTAKYDPNETVAKRHCVFAITSNVMEWLNDTTGARRFLPVEVGKCNSKLFAEHRDQILAEALVAYRAGEQWWFNEDDAIFAELLEKQEALQVVDPLEEIIIGYVTNKEGIQDTQVASRALLNFIECDVQRQTRQLEIRVGAIMRKLGFERKLHYVEGKRTRFWIKVGATFSEERSEPGTNWNQLHG